jgi:hypothetical protein
LYEQQSHPQAHLIDAQSLTDSAKRLHGDLYSPFGNNR